MLARREFLKAVLAATGGALLPGASRNLLRGLEPPARAAGPVRVVVVGAGLSGLAAAWELRQRGMARGNTSNRASVSTGTISGSRGAVTRTTALAR